MTTTTTYEIKVYCAITWPTGTPKGTMVRTFQVEEDSTILGSIRAIDKAVAQCGGLDLCEIHSPEITPNPAELGWPVN